MEGEWYEVPAATAEALARARAAGGRIVAVGTTTVRALESAAAVRGRTAGLAGGVSGWTDLTIVPGHEFRLVDTMVTNFHLPRSSLLLLVAAFAGRERVLDAYGHAVEAGYRFYSYGDAMLIL
jgi:S-adenosylmethionine:tRNA ribosyltransferase-isomerase